MSKQKVFRDAVHGYISVGDAYVNNLIDTFEMQRLKDVAQTGIRPIYSGATHDRFSHSLGVYHIGTKIFASMKNSVLEINRHSDEHPGLFPKRGSEEYAAWEKKLERYEKLYYVACLLHDIGHPALSHTFEYLYRNKYVNLEMDGHTIDFEEEYKRIGALLEKPESLACNTLKKKLQEKLNFFDDFKAQPHEMMSAYQILTSESLQKYIKTCIAPEDDGLPSDDYQFIARMIIGVPYNVRIAQPETDRVDQSVRNCIIALLNGVIDADSIDYLNRNSQVAGYDSYHLDVERLCNSFSVYWDSVDKIFRACFSKTALSAIEGFVCARDYEPKWLYNHHKIIYYDEYLIKYLYKKCNRYLFALNHLTNKEWLDGLCNDMINELQAANLLCGIDEEDRAPKDQEKRYKESVRQLNNKIFLGIGNSIGDSDFLTRYGSNETEEINLEDSGIPEIYKVPEKKELIELWNKWVKINNSDKRLGDLLHTCNDLFGIAARAFEEIGNQYKQTGDWAEAKRKRDDAMVIIKKYSERYSAMRESFLSNMVAPMVPFCTEHAYFYKSSDSDISTLFKTMHLHYKDKAYDALSIYEKAVGEADEFLQFQKALEEFNTRKYRQSLWKSEYEYRLILEEIGKGTALSWSTVHKEMLALIEKGTREEFEDPEVFNGDAKNLVYVNNGTAPTEFQRVFGIFGKGLILKIYHLHYKDFSKLLINFKKPWDAAPLVKTYGELGYTPKSDDYYPYLYYIAQEDEKYEDLKAKSSENLRDTFIENMVSYLNNKYTKGGGGTVPVGYIKNGKTIRDPIYGDIFIPKKFVAIIDTAAFQRLHRIKQLAAADYVFPEATHTRFAHSLGVFHIMGMMMEHFCSLFDRLNVQYSEADKDAILAAALLHDIGHGPFSHAFEKITHIDHEQWTKNIVLQDPELREVLDAQFGSEFAHQVIAYFNYFDEKPQKSTDNTSLSRVLTFLINSQLDADRLDYLLRDAYNTGIKLGAIDLQKIISAMELTSLGDDMCVCVNEDAVANIEQIIIGRYNMYDKVYNVPYKIYLEELLNKIVAKIFESSDAYAKSEIFRKLHESRNGKSLSVKDYLELDDYRLFAEIHHCLEGLESDNEVLTQMVKSFYNRSGYERVRILDETSDDIKGFATELLEDYKIDIRKMNGFIRPQNSYYAYDCKKNALLISKRNGTVSDISRESKIFTSNNRDGKLSDKLWLTKKECLYINYDILKAEKPDLKIDELKKFIASFDVRKHTEIEEKYSCSRETLETTKKYLADNTTLSLGSCRYDVELKGSDSTQSDDYYDTVDLLLAKQRYSLRCRSKNGYFTLSIKHSIDDKNGKNDGHFVRSEFEQSAETQDISQEKNFRFLERYLKKFFEENRRELSKDIFQKAIKIHNKRSCYRVVRAQSEFECEICLDDVTYEYEGKTQKDYQIEIELKSPHHIHKVELKNFAKWFRENFHLASPQNNEQESKYRKGLQAFGLI